MARSRMRNRERLLAKLAAIPDAVRKEIAGALDKGADEIVAMQKRLVPEDSGDLKRSIRKVKGTYTPENANVRGMASGGKGDPDLTVRIVAGDDKAWYARFVEFGTAPHTIKAKNPSGLLYFNGTRVPQVNHPGSEPRPFFYPAYRALRRRVKSRIARATTKAVKSVAGGGK